jgi:hypothetical protein
MFQRKLTTEFRRPASQTYAGEITMPNNKTLERNHATGSPATDVRGGSERFRPTCGDRAVIVGGEHAGEKGWFELILKSQNIAVITLDSGKHALIDYEDYRVEEELSL